MIPKGGHHQIPTPDEHQGGTRRDKTGEPSRGDVQSGDPFKKHFDPIPSPTENQGPRTQIKRG